MHKESSPGSEYGHNIPVPPRGKGRKGISVIARSMMVGDSYDVATHIDATAMVQTLRLAKMAGTQRKLLNGDEFHSTAVPVGEYFWRVWRLK